MAGDEVGGTMFTQVISGRVADRAALSGLVQRWVTELGPGADGWLSSTSGNRS